MKVLTVLFRDRNTDDDGWLYIAKHPELPGCMAQGDTADDARANLADVLTLYAAHRQEHGLPMPAAAAWSGGVIEWEVSG